MVGKCRDGNCAVLQSTTPSNALVKADPSEARALDPLLDALATRGFSPITSNPSLGALKTAYRVNVSKAHRATCGALRVTSFLCGVALLGNRHGHVGPTGIRQSWNRIVLSGGSRGLKAAMHRLYSSDGLQLFQKWLQAGEN